MADQRARRRMMWIVVLGAAAGALLLLCFEWSLPGLRAWLTERPDRTVARARLLLVLTGILTILPVIWFSAYLWLLGQRISNARRYPLPSMLFLRDVQVVSRPAAETRARVVKGMAVFLTAIGLGLLGLLWWIGKSIEESFLRSS